MKTTLIVCETCGRDAANPDVVRPGELLAQAIESALQCNKRDLRLKRFSCLMACSRSCTVQLRGEGKMGYVIGDLTPSAEVVQSLLAYSDKYHTSDTGVVPYKEWPEEIKGKFVARIPMLED